MAWRTRLCVASSTISFKIICGRDSVARQWLVNLDGDRIDGLPGIREFRWGTPLGNSTSTPLRIEQHGAAIMLVVLTFYLLTERFGLHRKTLTLAFWMQRRLVEATNLSASTAFDQGELQ